MLQTNISVRCSIQRSPRVLQIEGIFDLPPAAEAVVCWKVGLPLDERPWHIGLIVGPSGSGKSTIARRLWPDAYNLPNFAWAPDKSILDNFPAHLTAKEIVHLLSSVGFASPPAWLRPFQVLSTGQQFRVTLARLLAEQPTLAVLDEYTSVVDRTVAQIGSYALARTVRQRGQKFIALTCHEDVEPWLNPDWIYRPESNTFAWRLLQRRPAIDLEIRRVGREAWTLFKPHHYLSTDLSPAAVCFGAWWREHLVAFSAWIQSLTAQGGKREHRTVTLPDYQGAGIGSALSTFVASLWKALGQRATSTTTHPALIASRRRNSHWRLIRAPGLGNADGRRRVGHAVTRLTAGFEYVGPPLDAVSARELARSER